MKTQKFEFPNTTIIYSYEKIPTKETLEEICSRFYQKAMKNIEANKKRNEEEI